MVLKSIKDERGRDSGATANLPSNVVPRVRKKKSPHLQIMITSSLQVALFAVEMFALELYSIASDDPLLGAAAFAGTDMSTISSTTIYTSDTTLAILHST